MPSLCGLVARIVAEKKLGVSELAQADRGQEHSLAVCRGQSAGENNERELPASNL